MKAGKLAILPWLSSQYIENMLMDIKLLKLQELFKGGPDMRKYGK
jgi:hypothetical protein